MMTVYTRVKYIDREKSKVTGGKNKYKIYYCKAIDGNYGACMV